MNLSQFLKKHIIIGAIMGIVSAFVMIAVFASIMIAFKIDRAYSAFFATVSVAVGAFVSAFFCSKKSGSKGYIIGIITGLIYFFVITIIGLFLDKGGLSSNTVFHLVIVLLSSTIGGILGVNRKKNTKLI